ncbi:MAG: mitofilin family membrane protein [Alphaproteobacteria bacterium]
MTRTETSARPRRRPRYFLVSFTMLLLILAGAYISWPLWRDTLPGWARAGLTPVMEAGRGGAMEGRLATLGKRLNRIETALGALRKDLAQVARPDPAAAIAAAKRVTALENTLAELRADVVEKAGGTELARLAARLDAVENRPAPVASNAGPEATAAIETLRAQSARRMATLEKENDALRHTIAGINQRIGAIGATASAPAGPGTGNALLLAVGQLREATRGTGGFAEALGAVAALSRGDATITAMTAKLTPHAGKGVADLTLLRSRFATAAGAIARADMAPAGGNWVDRTIARISNLVTIRQVGETAAARNDAQGLIARAELRLAAGDLAGAVAALGRLRDAPAKAAAAWLAAARARLAVDAAVAGLFAHALGAVSAEPRG